eukprot:TRINITY_DN2950_c0_g1_i1.p1 TRINITY_DN2950_c0_g1~~TRINITY_DN2950_c0_g1_i1.p1  ORF type:complete len:260 (-),score=54.89 TRINITY_DN2950_c0_g1_i1:61-840(-)
MQQAKELYDQLSVLANQPQPNAEKTRQLLNTLKVATLRLSTPAPNSDPNVISKDLFLAREILETSALVSIKLQDETAFEKYIAQLKPFYYDYNKLLPQSERQYPILGLYLLHLLSKGASNAEFHSELEVITDHENRYIKYAITLEQDIMEGRYNKVWKARETAPSEYYVFFLDKLSGTIRNDVASCLQVAYDKISTSEATKMLLFKDESELRSFVQEHNWHIDGNTVSFTQENHGAKEVPAVPLIHHSLRYAQELERII